MPLIAWVLQRHRFLALMKEAAPRCAECSYILKHLKPKGRSIRCPECGHAESIRNVVDRFRRHKNIAERTRRFAEFSAPPLANEPGGKRYRLRNKADAKSNDPKTKKPPREPKKPCDDDAK